MVLPMKIINLLHCYSCLTCSIFFKPYYQITRIVLWVSVYILTVLLLFEMKWMLYWNIKHILHKCLINMYHCFITNILNLSYYFSSYIKPSIFFVSYFFNHRLIDPTSNIIRTVFALADISFWAAHNENKRFVIENENISICY